MAPSYARRWCLGASVDRNFFQPCFERITRHPRLVQRRALYFRRAYVLGSWHDDIAMRRAARGSRHLVKLLPVVERLQRRRDDRSAAACNRATCTGGRTAGFAYSIDGSHDRRGISRLGRARGFH